MKLGIKFGGCRSISAPLAMWLWTRSVPETGFPGLFFCPIPNFLWGDPLKSFILSTFIMATYSTSAYHCYVVIVLFFNLKSAKFKNGLRTIHGLLDLLLMCFTVCSL